LAIFWPFDHFVTIFMVSFFEFLWLQKRAFLKKVLQKPPIFGVKMAKKWHFCLILLSATLIWPKDHFFS